MNLLLHICCANCGLVPIELLKDQFGLTLYWYNPNIQPKIEYEKRLADVKKLVEIYQLPLITGQYENKKWFELVRGLEKEPEATFHQGFGWQGGKRCEICFRMRLEKTAQYAAEKSFDYFATTLSISRYKNTNLINQIGQALAEKYGVKYYLFEIDKNKTAKRELELSKKYNFYRQKYCGCVYSQK